MRIWVKYAYASDLSEVRQNPMGK